MLEQVEQVGFIDFEDLGSDKVYFNGNLFRRGTIAKTQAVLNSLTDEDRKSVQEVEALLTSFGCVSLKQVAKVLGAPLLEKLNAISMYDINIVNNDQENIAFVTRPAAFSKFGNPLVEDALDLAKAFVSSLTYGMTRSTHARGRIRMFEKLMNALIAGRWNAQVGQLVQFSRTVGWTIHAV